MPEKQLPLSLESVLERLVLRYLMPVTKEIVCVRYIRVPNRPGRLDAVLDLAIPKSRDCASVHSINLKAEQFVPVDTHAPGRIDLRDYAVFQFEERVGSIICSRVVPMTFFIVSDRDMSGADCADALYRTEQIIEHVTPMAEHIQNDAASIFRTVIPGRTLSWLPISFENPVTKLASHRQDFSEESAFDEMLKLSKPGQKQFVLYNSIFDASLCRQSAEFKRCRQVFGNRFFAVDMFTGG